MLVLLLLVLLLLALLMLALSELALSESLALFALTLYALAVGLLVLIALVSTSGANQDNYLPTRIEESSPMSPKTLRSHKTTTMTTTAFKIALMEPAMGIYVLMR
jgi:hypothetical protein